MTVKTAQETHTDTTLIMARLFNAPKPWKTVFPLLALCLASGLLVEVSLAGLVTFGLLVFALPALLGALLTKPLANLLGGKTYLRRTVLLSVVTQFMILGVLLIAAAVRVAGVAVALDRLVILATASTVWVRQVVMASTSQSHPVKNLPSILAQPLLGFGVLLLLLPGAWSLPNLGLAFALTVVFLLSAIAFTEVANRPLKKTFGVSGLRMMRHFLDHMTEPDGDGQEEIEEFFDSFAVPMSVPVAVLGLRSASAMEAVIVVPGIHPGPFGTAGGSDLPAKVKREFGGLTANILVPHAPSTHDNNPATTGEVRKVASKARDLLAAAVPARGGSRLARAQVGKATVTAQRFGDAVFCTASLAPNPTDDIDAATGFAATLAARDAGAREALFVDAHNSLAVGSGWVVFGSPEARDLIEATRRAVAETLRRPEPEIRVGAAQWFVTGSVEQGLGEAGVQCLAVQAGAQRVAYLLFDGNNMVPGLREQIRSAVMDLVEECEVLTTDNHSVNIALGGFNPVGARLDQARLVATARGLVEKAFLHLAEVTGAAASGHVDEVRVWGHESTTRLSTGINSTVSVLRITAGVSLALAFALSVLGLVLAS
jgi:putative membrane protein